MSGHPQNDPSPTTLVVLAGLALLVLVIGLFTVVKPELENAPDDLPDAGASATPDAGV